MTDTVTTGPYGFAWGALQVERTAALPDERVAPMIRTDAGRTLTVYCSRTGRSLRVFDGKGNEPKPETP